MRRVVITGMGIYSCIGKNQDEVKDSLFQGRSGIGIDPARKEMGYFSALTGLVERPDLKKLLDRKKRHSLAEQGEYAYMATLEAFRQAQIDEEFLLNHEVGILYGNDSSAAPVIEAIDVIRAKKNTAMVGSGSIFQSMNSTITMNLSVIFHLKGINFTISGACASGSHAIIIRKTKCFDFWERNVLFPKTKRSFFRTPTPLPCPFPLNFSLLIITKKFGNFAKNRYICIV